MFDPLKKALAKAMIRPIMSAFASHLDVLEDNILQGEIVKARDKITEMKEGLAGARAVLEKI